MQRARSDYKNSQLSDIAVFAARQVLSQLPAGAKLAISLIDLSENQSMLQRGDFEGEEFFYPASIVKLFFLAAACIQLEKNQLVRSDEFMQALSEMIVDSSNSATSYVVDLLTDTCSGEQLPPEQMLLWARKRQSLNEIFETRGYKGINICQKTWDEAPYGRDEIFLGADRNNRNRLTANHAAKLMAQIVQGEIAGPEYTEFMMDLLKRDCTKTSEDPDDQSTKFCGSALACVDGARLWSKAGWTSKVRHDAAYIELPASVDKSTRIVLVIFTSGCSDNHELIPQLAQHVLARAGRSGETQNRP